jgi:hypothetical protein
VKIWVLHFDSGSKVFLGAENAEIAEHIGEKWFRERVVDLYPLITEQRRFDMS